MKKFLGILLLSFIAAISLAGFSACDTSGSGDTEQDGAFLTVYNSYVVYAEENGETPLSYEEWLKTIKGEKGADGITPTIEISADGFWVINGVKTEYKAIGEDGKDGKDGVNGTNGTNGINGKDGVTPTIEISADGFWIINGEKTEYKAIGEDGKDGKDGKDGVNGTSENGSVSIEISADGFWIINGTKTAYKAIGEDGKDGKDGKDGVNGEKGVGIVSIAKKSTDGSVDLYEIEFSDGTSTTFTVINGINGNDAPHYGEEYTVEFNVNGGTLTGESTVVVKYGDTLTLPLPIRDNFVFEGWFTGTSVNDGKFTSITPVTKNITLIAKWKAEQSYHLSFQTNGGNGIAMREYYAEDEIYELPTPSKSDCVFTGWFLDEKLSQRVAYPLILSEDTTVYAQWGTAYYTVNFYTFTTNAISPITAVAGTVYNSFTAPVNGDKKFAGWYYDSGFKTEVSFPLELHNNINLYAKWEDAYFTISFNSNGGTAVNAQSYVSGYVLSELPTPEKDNYRFTGWYSNGDLTVKVALPYTVSENIVFYAKWTYVDPYADYIKIYNGVDFQKISSNLNGKYVLMNDIDLEGASISQFGDIDKPFTGTLDGQHHSVSNFETSAGATSSQNFGIFTQNNGSIINIKFLSVTSAGNFGKGASYHGILTSINNGVIFGVTVRGSRSISINDNYNSFSVYLGVICAVNNGTISDCEALGEINTGAGAANMHKKYAGGICGENRNKILNCYCKVVLSDTKNGSDMYGAGICARNYGEIKSVLFTGTVNGFTKHCAAITAIQETGSSEENCYSYSNVTGGNSVTISYLNNYSFYSTSLGWDANIWNYRNLDYNSGKNPTLK